MDAVVYSGGGCDDVCTVEGGVVFNGEGGVFGSDRTRQIVVACGGAVVVVLTKLVLLLLVAGAMVLKEPMVVGLVEEACGLVVRP